MRIALNLLTIMMLSLLWCSCSTIDKSSGSDNKLVMQLSKTASEVNAIDQERFQQALVEASKRLTSMIEEAKKTGPNAVDFLAGDLFLKASDSSLRGESETARFLFEHLLKLKPNDVYLARRYAIELIRVGRIKDSAKHLRRVYRKSKGRDSSIGLILGGVYIALDNYKKARKVYRQVLKNDPKNEEACVFLAKAYAKAKRFRQANNTLIRCEKRSPKAGIFSYYRGKIAVDRKKFATAKKYFERALKRDGNYYQAAMAIGLIHESRNHLKKAIKAYESFLKKDPLNYAILSRLVLVMFAESKFKRVIPYAERLISIDPEDLNLKVRLGILYTDARRYEDAKEVFKEILSLTPDSDKILYYLASLHQQTDESDKAIKYFSKINEDSSLFHDSILQVGQLLNMAASSSYIDGNKHAVERFLKFVEDKSKKHEKVRLDLQVMLAGFHESNGEYTQAIKAVFEAKKSKKYTDAHDYYLASLFEKNKEFDNAYAIMEEMLKKDPKNSDVLNFLGYSYLERGVDLDMAHKYISRAIALKPDDGYIRDSYGWYFYKKGDLKRALKEVKKAWEKVKSDVVINKHLAIIYSDLRRYKSARKFYREALKNCKVESERIDLMDALKGVERQLRLPASAKE